MSISFPLNFVDFWDLFQVLDGTSEFQIVERMAESEDGGGNTIGARLGQSKIMCDVMIAPMYSDLAGRVTSMITVLIGRSGTLYAYDRLHPYPIKDPTGSIVGSSTVQVRTKGSDNRSLSLKGLPASYSLTAGDWMSVTYSSGKKALLRVGEDVTANGSGITSEFEVYPFLSTGIAVDDNVDLKKPEGKFEIVRGSYRPGTLEGRRLVGCGFSIRSVQK